MNEAPAFDFKIGEPVTLDGKRYYWGPRSGSYRVLRFTPKGGGGIMANPALVGKTIFPGTNEYGSYDERHAVTLTYRNDIDMSIRVRVIQVAENTWLGGVDAVYGEAVRTTGVLHPSLPRYESADKALTVQLRLVVEDLAKYGKRCDEAKLMAKDALVDLLKTVAPSIREAVLAEAGSA